MNDELYLELLYQINLLYQILSREEDVLKIEYYKGMLDSLLYILSII